MSKRAAGIPVITGKGITVKQGRPRKSALPGYPRVTPRVSRDAEYNPILGKSLSDFAAIQAAYPFGAYDVIDLVSILDPYVAKFVYSTVALGNPGHKLYINAPSESRADEAIQVCNDLAARCFPFGGGLDGLVNGMLHQLARTSGTCVEWVPDKRFTGIQRAFLVPVKTLRFRYDDQGNTELVQLQNDGKVVPLQPLQTSFHGLILRDSSPYPIPIILSALRAARTHSKIMDQIEAWIEKVSGLGVLLATVTSPPREGGETQEQYDAKATDYLNQLAQAIRDNLNSGLGIGYDNINFQFHSTQAGAQGAKDLLQVNLQGLFAALQTDPVFFGWNFGASDTFARVVFQQMLQMLKIFRLGVKRAIEHGHRLNLALNGMADVQVTLRFKDDINIDLFKEAEAEQMKTQAIMLQLEGKVITKAEARKILGHEDKTVEAGAYVAALNRGTNEYVRERFAPSVWTEGNAAPQLTTGAGDEEGQN